VVAPLVVVSSWLVSSVVVWLVDVWLVDVWLVVAWLVDAWLLAACQGQIAGIPRLAPKRSPAPEPPRWPGSRPWPRLGRPRGSRVAAQLCRDGEGHGRKPRRLRRIGVNLRSIRPGHRLR
jgi:hypothetical protein